MEFVITKQLTNTRPPKSDACELITTPTPGNMRLTENAAILLGVTTGDYVSLLEAKIDGKEVILVHKGWKNEDGNVGSKVASAGGKTGGAMIFSSANAYNTLKGNTETNLCYELSDEPIEKDGIKYHTLTFVREVPKAERSPREVEEESVQA